MPIYAYKCSSCGVTKDILRKISDPPLVECPACGKDTLAKQVTAAGFQLKGSGWYVTDFRGGDAKSSSQATPDKASEGASPQANTDKASGGASEKSAQTSSATPSSTPVAASVSTSTPSATSGAST